MARPRKDGEKISLYLDRPMMEKVRAYADERGQTLTMAMERIIKAHLEDKESLPTGEYVGQNEKKSQ